MANTIFAAKVDLNQGVKRTYLNTIFAENDANAHRFDIEVYRGRESVSLTDAKVSASFIRSDGVTVHLLGSAAGHIASVTLNESCYIKPGTFTLTVKVTIGEEISTVFYGEGSVFISMTDRVVDDEHIIPSIEKVLANIDKMEPEIENAKAAAAEAREAAATCGITVCGHFETLSLLEEMYPVGSADGAYAVGRTEPYEVYVWNPDVGYWQSLGHVDINGVDRSYKFKALRRKVLGITGGLYNHNKRLKAIEQDTNCAVTEVVTPTETNTMEYVRIRCGQSGFKLALRLDADQTNMYRITSIDSLSFSQSSVYANMGGARNVTQLKEINIDNHVHEDFSALKVEGFTFKRLCLIYESTGTHASKPFTCLTTLYITPDGFTVLETVDEAAAGALPKGFIKDTKGYVKEKATHGKRMIFGFSGKAEPPYHNTYVETIENDGCTSMRRFSFEGVN